EISSGPFLHARLFPGEAGFGGLVYRVRSKAEEIAMEKGLERILIDGSAGIGCQVLASIAGCDLVLIVAEPTLSGWSDFVRIRNLCAGLGVRMAVCVNKHDINPAITDRIERFCGRENILFAGKIPFEESVMLALENGKVLVEAYPESRASRGIKLVAANIGIVDAQEGSV
ncbi:unnamed protein product, partial [marine sediment metagenome]